MSASLWNRAGGTLSHKNACKEFGLTEEEIFTAMKAGKLQYRQNYAHGNPYFRLLRPEVEALVLDLRGSESAEAQELEFKLQEVSKEIRSLENKLKKLKNERDQLLAKKKK